MNDVKRFSLDAMELEKDLSRLLLTHVRQSVLLNPMVANVLILRWAMRSLLVTFGEEKASQWIEDAQKMAQDDIDQGRIKSCKLYGQNGEEICPS